MWSLLSLIIYLFQLDNTYMLLFASYNISIDENKNSKLIQLFLYSLKDVNCSNTNNLCCAYTFFKMCHAQYQANGYAQI